MIVLALFLVAIVGIEMPIHNNHPDFQPFVDEYLTIINKECLEDQINYPKKTAIFYTNSFPDNQIAGECERWDGGWDIIILRSEWDKITPDDKRVLIFHELSHCMLLKEHVESPDNYMYSSIVDLNKDVVYDQVLEDAWTHCGTK